MPGFEPARVEIAGKKNVNLAEMKEKKKTIARTQSILMSHSGARTM